MDGFPISSANSFRREMAASSIFWNSLDFLSKSTAQRQHSSRPTALWSAVSFSTWPTKVFHFSTIFRAFSAIFTTAVFVRAFFALGQHVSCALYIYILWRHAAYLIRKRVKDPASLKPTTQRDAHKRHACMGVYIYMCMYLFVIFQAYIYICMYVYIYT